MFSVFYQFMCGLDHLGRILFLFFAQPITNKLLVMLCVGLFRHNKMQID
jgi:hypothetical protein